MLMEALLGIKAQVTHSRFVYDAVVVDNDAERSAENIVAAFKAKAPFTVTYDCEPENNIALTRNRAISNARGSLLAFIDDDEIPLSNWLITLYRILKHYDCDGVLGPVLPYYSAGAPDWIVESNVFNRKRFKTGTRLANNMRTGNALIKREIISNDEIPFNPGFGLTGGEDVDFFERKITAGKTFVWCDEAIVYETVPPERWTIAFHSKRFFRIGTINGKRMRARGVGSVLPLIKTFGSLTVSTILLVVKLPLGKRHWVLPFLKILYAIGTILSFTGLISARER
jgi:succinoglycan biosynthesis protein ExoM